MTRLLLLLCTTCTLLCISCDPGTPNPPATANVAGTYYETLTTSDGQNREYIVYVPASAAGQQAVPVLFMIHGTNQTGQAFYNNPNLWNPKADQEGFIVVYPTALVYCHFDNGQQRTVTKWASGNLGETDTSMGALPLCPGEVLRDDVLFFDELTATIRNDYVVDEKRLYVSGFSNGAQMASRLAAERSDVYAAVTVHAGNYSAFLPTTLSSRPMSVLITVGAEDGFFLNAIGETPPLTVDSTLMAIPGVKDAVQPFLDINGLESSFAYTSGQFAGEEFADFLFDSSTQGLSNSVNFVVLDGLLHQYTNILIDPYWTFLEAESLP